METNQDYSREARLVDLLVILCKHILIGLIDTELVSQDDFQHFCSANNITVTTLHIFSNK
jgi:hypothetical protein